MSSELKSDPERASAVIDIAKIAGNTILELFSAEIPVTRKTDDTPLTAADLAANRIITEKLQAMDPAFPILSEESCSMSLAERDSWETYWLVDPLDGTREFIKQNGEFSVNIALIHQGLPVLGVVHAPALEITYWASRGGGAWKRIGDETPRKISVRTAPDSVTVALGWGNKRGTKIHQFLKNLGDHKTVRMGGALKSCLVAEGRADIYACLGPTGEWDTGAAQCIVEEAGGQITNTNMQTIRYNTKQSLLNPHFFVFGISNHNWCDYLD